MSSIEMVREAFLPPGCGLAARGGASGASVAAVEGAATATCVGFTIAGDCVATTC